VLSVVGTGADLAAARTEAYDIMARVSLTGGHFRTDIGLSAVEGRISIPS
jgi:phosphoribosylamine--glycine ligase